MKIETALALDRIFKVKVPVPCPVDSLRRMGKMQLRKPCAWLNRDASVTFHRIAVPWQAGMHQLVISAKCHQRTQLEFTLPSFRFIFDHQRALAIHQEEAFHNGHAACLKRKSRKWIEPELRQEPVARRMGDAWIEVGGKLEAFAL